MDNLKEIHIWNVKYNLLSVEEIVLLVDKWISSGKKGIHLTGANPETIAIAQEDPLQKEAILESDIVNVDSFLPTLFLRRKGYDIKQRVPSPDVFEKLLQLADKKRQKVFFLGAKETTLVLLREKIEKEYPGINIVGMQNGYFKETELDEIASQIAQQGPDYLFIALPSPRKEKFILKYKHSINVGCLYGVGGAFDAMAGVLKRPPTWLQKYGMEYWLRVIRAPQMYVKRMPLYFKFLRLAISQ